MRNYSFDTLKLICAILVIIAHTKQPEYISKFTAPLIYCAVQTFFVISGYFTYGKINLYNIIHKRIISTTKLFIWSFLLYFLCFILVNGQDSLQHINLLFTYKFLIFNTVPYGMHLWYIAAYIYILIIMLIVEKYNLYRVLFCLTPILLMCALAMGKYSNYIFNYDIETFFSRNFLFTGLPFFTIGMMIKHAQAHLKYKKIAIAGCLIFHILGLKESSIPNLGNGDWLLTTIFFSTFILILFLNIKQSKDNILSKTGREDGLYIYIFHFLFVIIYSKIFDKILPHYYQYFSTILVLTSTLILIYTLRKLNIIGRII